MAEQLILPQALDSNGDPISGAKANVYETGTTTRETVYQNTGLSTPHANPILADSEGRFAQAFYGGSKTLKVVFTDASDVEIETMDPAQVVSISASAAEDVTFTPVTGVASTDVQAAIAQVQTNLTAEIAALKTGYEFIESLDASGSASLDFDTLDTATYDAFKIVLGGIVPATDNVSLLCNPSSNGGSSHTSVGYAAYSGHNSSPAAINGGGPINPFAVALNVGNDANEWGVFGEITIPMPSINFAANFSTTYRDNGTNIAHLNGAIGVNVAAAINAVQIIFSSGNITSGTATLYGLRNA